MALTSKKVLFNYTFWKASTLKNHVELESVLRGHDLCYIRKNTRIRSWFVYTFEQSRPKLNSLSRSCPLHHDKAFWALCFTNRRVVYTLKHIHYAATTYVILKKARIWACFVHVFEQGSARTGHLYALYNTKKSLKHDIAPKHRSFTCPRYCFHKTRKL